MPQEHSLALSLSVAGKSAFARMLRPSLEIVVDVRKALGAEAVMSLRNPTDTKGRFWRVLLIAVLWNKDMFSVAKPR